MPNRGNLNSSTFNGQPSGVGGFTPTLQQGDESTRGVWDIDGFTYDDVKGQWRLTEKRSAVKAEIPAELFALDDFPNADPDIIGEPIPIAFGDVKGLTAFLVDSAAFKFKVCNHLVKAFTKFYDSNGTSFAPNSVDVSDGTFIFTSWDGDTQLFCDVLTVTSNPVDVVKELLTSTTRGAGLPLTELDTSTNGGFGSAGARLKYVVGTDTRSGDEVNSFEIGLYIKDQRPVTEIIDEVKAAAIGFVYVDSGGLWQYKAWEAAVSEGTLEVTETQIKMGTFRPSVKTNDSITKAVATYNINHGIERSNTVTYLDDELRQKRGLTIHTVEEKELPISNKSGAELWTQYKVNIQGKPRRAYAFTSTNEGKELEPGDTIRLNYAPLEIDQVVTLNETTQVPGKIEVGIKANDVFGFQDLPGFWTLDAPVFPDRLGGDTIPSWNDTTIWTDAQKLWARENLGFWTDDNGYADVAVDPEQSYLASIWS